MVNIWVNYLLLYKQQATETRSLSRLLVGYLLRICTNPVGGGGNSHVIDSPNSHYFHFTPQRYYFFLNCANIASLFFKKKKKGSGKPSFFYSTLTLDYAMRAATSAKMA